MDTITGLHQNQSEDVTSKDVPVNNSLDSLPNDAYLEEARNIPEYITADITGPMQEHEQKESDIVITQIQEDEEKLQPIQFLPQESQQQVECLDDLRQISSQAHTFENETMLELSRSSWGTQDQLYLQGCKWSPDQTCILTAVNRNGMHIFELPHDLYEMDAASYDRPVDILQSAVFIKENGTVYDYCWYPNMNSLIPATCW